MKVLVTGATGFIGRHAAACLLKRKDISLTLLLLESEQHLAGQFPNAKIVLGTLTDEAAVRRAVQGQDAVVHLASKSIDHDATGFKKINIDGTALLCREAAGAGINRFIYLSTVGVYGHRRHDEADEETPVRPDTDFSRSKAEAERIVLDHHARGDFSAVILRHRFVYGTGDRHVLPRMIRAARSYPFLISSGRARISLVLVNDLADVICRFLLTAAGEDEHPVYHVTDGIPVSYKDLIYRICDEYGYKRPGFSLPFSLLHVPVKLKELLLGIDPEKTKSSISSMRLKLIGLDNCFSNRKLRERFPQLTFTPFQEAFGGLADYYREQQPGPGVSDNPA